MATSRNLQDASGIARVIVTTDGLDCQRSKDAPMRRACVVKSPG